MTRVSSTLALLALLASSAAPALAHPKAVLRSSQSSIAVGEQLPVAGERFGARGSFRLVLAGALSEYTLREVTADSAGTFSVDVTIPDGTRPGQYRLLVFASDGDEVAALDLSILPALAAESPPANPDHLESPEGEHVGDAAGMELPKSIVPERSWSGIEWGVVGLVIGLAAGLGVALLRTQSSLGLG